MLKKGKLRMHQSLQMLSSPTMQRLDMLLDNAFIQLPEHGMHVPNPAAAARNCPRQILKMALVESNLD